MNSLQELLISEISSQGSIGFERFMEVALYHPRHGYYCNAGDPFGFEGDFYTNSQMQPVFGRLLAQKIASWHREMGSPPDFTLVELGCGRGETIAEIRRCLPDIKTVAVDREDGEIPNGFKGIVLANEFFDALPVSSVERSREGVIEHRVGFDGERFVFLLESDCNPSFYEYIEHYHSGLPLGVRTEVSFSALGYIERIANRMESGYLVVFDYGYELDEIRLGGRFANGSLMSYRRHRCDEDVLAEPGYRDITAHVNFSALDIRARELGFEVEPLQSQTAFLMSIGSSDDFRAALHGDSREEFDLRMKLKSLLFGIGESFRVFVARKS